MTKEEESFRSATTPIQIGDKFNRPLYNLKVSPLLILMMGTKDPYIGGSYIFLL